MQFGRIIEHSAAHFCVRVAAVRERRVHAVHEIDESRVLHFTHRWAHDRRARLGLCRLRGARVDHQCAADALAHERLNVQVRSGRQIPVIACVAVPVVVGR